MIAAHTPSTAPDPAAGLPTLRVPAPPIDPADLPPGIDHPLANEVISHYLRGGQDTDVGELGLTLNLAVRTVIQVIDSPFAQRIFSDIKRLALQRSEIAAAEGRTQAVYVTRRIAATSPSDEVARRAANALLNFRTVTEVPTARGGTDPDDTPARPRGPRPPRPPHPAPPAGPDDQPHPLVFTRPVVPPPPAPAPAPAATHLAPSSDPTPTPPTPPETSDPPGSHPAAPAPDDAPRPALAPRADPGPAATPRAASGAPTPPTQPNQHLATIALRAAALVARLAETAGTPAPLAPPARRARDSPAAA